MVRALLPKTINHSDSFFSIKSIFCILLYLLKLSMDSDKQTKNRKPLKLFGGNKLPKDWNAEKAMNQMREVSGNWSSVEESLIALGFRR